MIILKCAANFGGEIKKAGDSVSLSPLVENRMIENGLAYRKGEEKQAPQEPPQGPPQAPPQEPPQSPPKVPPVNPNLICPVCGKQCKNQLGFNNHVKACQKKAEQ